MKKSLYIRTALLGSASALAVGAAVLPATTFAAESGSSQTAHHDGMQRPPRGPRGVVGTVSNVSVNADGVGTLQLTIVAPPKPENMPAADDSSHHRPLAMFLHNHPDLPKPGETITINLTSDTKYMIDGQESTAAGLTSGTTVRVLGGGKDSDDRTAKLITTTLMPPMRGFMGTVSAIDTGANTMTVSFPATDKHAAATVTVQYSDSTKFVEKDVTNVTESSVTVGDKVRFDGKLSTGNGTSTVTDVHMIGIKE